jgi:F0F1-type ATP synthase membrane subunit c/vacuolar-type H+-ATPase subunit K
MKKVFSMQYLVYSLLAMFLLLSTAYYILPTAHAQLEVAETFDVPPGSTDGDILSYSEKGIVLSTKENDEKIFGIIETEPLVAYRRNDNTGMPVIRNGTVDVNVTTINGPINTGDLVTSSVVPGKGERSKISGYIVGVAMESFSETDGEEFDYNPPAGTGQARKVRTGKINVALKIEYSEITTARSANRLFDAINAAFFRNVNDPERFVNIVRYLLAGLAVVIAFLISFFTLARSIPKGIEALGRNPLARNTIQFGIILNIIFTVGIALVGIAAAIILLRF